MVFSSFEEVLAMLWDIRVKGGLVLFLFHSSPDALP